MRDDKDVKLEDIPIVRDFLVVFPKELPRLPPKREVEFTIELVSGMTPISKVSYPMAPLELKELKTQLQEMLDRCFIRPRVFVKKKDRTLTVKNKYPLPRIDDLFD